MMIHVQYWIGLLVAYLIGTTLGSGCWGLQQRRGHLLLVLHGGLVKTIIRACFALQDRPCLHYNLCCLLAIFVASLQPVFAAEKGGTSYWCPVEVLSR